MVNWRLPLCSSLSTPKIVYAAVAILVAALAYNGPVYAQFSFPSDDDRPGPHNTGHDFDESKLIDMPGDLFINTPTTLENVRIIGNVTIDDTSHVYLDTVLVEGSIKIYDSDSVAITNTKIEAGGAKIAFWTLGTGNFNIRIEDSTIMDADRAIYGSNYIVRRCEIRDINLAAIGVNGGAAYVDSNWLHTLGQADNPLFWGRGIDVYSTDGSYVFNNVIDLRACEIKGCIPVRVEGASSNNYFVHNWLLGHSWRTDAIVYLHYANNGTPDHTNIIANYFSRDVNRGYVLDTPNSATLIQCNRWQHNNELVDFNNRKCTQD